MDTSPVAEAQFIADENGQGSSGRPTGVGAGTGDSIAGDPVLTRKRTYQGRGLRGAANVWIIAR